MLYGVCIDFHRWQSHGKYYRRQLHRGVNREFRRSRFIFAVHAVRTRGRNNKPPSSLSAPEATGGMHTPTEIYYLCIKRNIIILRMLLQPYVLYYAEHFRILRAINALTDRLQCKPRRRFVRFSFYCKLCVARCPRANEQNIISRLTRLKFPSGDYSILAIYYKRAV